MSMWYLALIVLVTFGSGAVSSGLFIAAVATYTYDESKSQKFVIWAIAVSIIGIVSMGALITNA